jgi:predicted Zn-dependent protease
MPAAPDSGHPMPDDPSIDDCFDEANGHLAIGELDEAIELYRRCVENSPTFFDGWHALGMALMKTDQLKEAIGCGLQAVSLKPNDLLAWTSLSQMYVRDGNIPEAEAAKANARILSLGGRIVKDES